MEKNKFLKLMKNNQIFKISNSAKIDCEDNNTITCNDNCMIKCIKNNKIYCGNNCTIECGKNNFILAGNNCNIICNTGCYVNAKKNTKICLKWSNLNGINDIEDDVYIFLNENNYHYIYISAILDPITGLTKANFINTFSDEEWKKNNKNILNQLYGDLNIDNFFLF